MLRSTKRDMGAEFFGHLVTHSLCWDRSVMRMVSRRVVRQLCHEPTGLSGNARWRAEVGDRYQE